MQNKNQWQTIPISGGVLRHPHDYIITVTIESMFEKWCTNHIHICKIRKWLVQCEHKHHH